MKTIRSTNQFLHVDGSRDGERCSGARCSPITRNTAAIISTPIIAETRPTSPVNDARRANQLSSAHVHFVNAAEYGETRFTQGVKRIRPLKIEFRHDNRYRRKAGFLRAYPAHHRKPWTSYGTLRPVGAHPRKGNSTFSTPCSACSCATTPRCRHHRPAFFADKR